MDRRPRVHVGEPVPLPHLKLFASLPAEPDAETCQPDDIRLTDVGTGRLGCLVLIVVLMVVTMAWPLLSVCALGRRWATLAVGASLQAY